jgi:hypothetical protein
MTRTRRIPRITVSTVVRISLAFSLGITAKWSCDKITHVHDTAQAVEAMSVDLDSMLAANLNDLVHTIDDYSTHTDSLLKEPIQVVYPPFPPTARETVRVEVPVTRTVTVYDTIPFHIVRASTSYVELPQQPTYTPISGWRVDERRP